jgi:alkaline phosphatase
MNRALFLRVATVLPLVFLAAAVILTSAVPVQAVPARQTETSAKYIFLFIGDGMGMTQRRAAEMYLTALRGSPLQTRRSHLWMNSFPAQGLTTTLAADSATTDSAAAATAIATGQKTLPEIVGMDSHALVNLPTLAEIAKAHGMRVGVITNVPINHATPAAFYAHVPSRTNYYAIGQDLVRSGFNYFCGGPFIEPKGVSGQEPELTGLAQAAGYTLIEDKAGLQSLQPGADKVLALARRTQDAQALYYAIDRSPNDLSLVDFTRKGIQLLDNPNGFFIVVEGGKIDWAAHANDAAGLLHEVLDLDAAIAEAVAFYNHHPQETLIIVTSDHDTGGMNLNFAGSAYAPRISRLAVQQSSFHQFALQVAEYRAVNPSVRYEDAQAFISSKFGTLPLTGSDQAALNRAFDLSMLSVDLTGDEEYGNYDPLTVELTTLLDYKAGIFWTSGSHTRLPVQTSALGAGSAAFNRYYDNSEIFFKILTAAGF